MVYTSPEIAWVGRTEQQLKADGVAYKAGTFRFWPMAAHVRWATPRAWSSSLADAKTDEILGVHMVGPMVQQVDS